MMNFLKYFILLVVVVTFSCSTRESKSNSVPELTTRIQDSLAFELCKIYGSDQGIRDMKLLQSKSGALKFSPHLDSINFYKLINFIKVNGYPSEKLLGKENFSHECVQGALGVVLLHNPHRLVNEKKYFQFFLNEVEKGNMNREGLALVLDKYYWVRRDKYGNKKVLYGTQFGKPCRMYRKKSDSVRATIGLKPLADSLFIDCNK